MLDLIRPVRTVLRPFRNWVRNVPNHIPQANHDLLQERERLLQMLATTQDQHRHAVDQHRQAAEQIALLTAEPDPSRGPSIVLSTLPKSGSIYLLSVLERGLNYKAFNVSLGYFPHDLIDWVRLRTASRGGAITQSHFDASPANLQILRTVQPRVQVHLRDPRQATLSMMHHVLRLWATSDRLSILALDPVPPIEFFDCPFESQIDWMIDHYLPSCVGWIEKWLEVIDRGDSGLTILLSTFEEMIRDESTFLQRTLEFFGIAASRFQNPNMKKSLATHFRQGTADEWQRVFSREQKERALQVIPPSLRERFQWPK